MSGKGRPWYEAIFDDSFFNFPPKNSTGRRGERLVAHESLRLADGAC
jgi:hypothetical protein